MANIIIVEDQTIVLEALKMLIEERSEHRVVGTFNHPVEALNKVRNIHYPVDLAIFDVRLPEMNGVELTREMAKKMPDMKIILLTQYPNGEYIKAGVKHGASGYLLKSVDPDELIVAISWVLEGRNYFCKKATKSLLSISVQDELKMTLSPREKQVLVHIAKGFTVKEISAILEITESTVNHYKECIRNKLQIKKITDMTRYAYESGLIDLEDL